MSELPAFDASSYLGSEAAIAALLAAALGATAGARGMTWIANKAELN